MHQTKPPKTRTPDLLSQSALAERYRLDRRKVARVIEDCGLEPSGESAHRVPLYDEAAFLYVLKDWTPSLPPLTDAEVARSAAAVATRLLDVQERGLEVVLEELKAKRRARVLAYFNAYTAKQAAL